MTTKPENPPAFPRQYCDHASSGAEQDGMTLRDYFAAQAMNGIQSQLRYNADEYYILASASYQVADAMLKARQS